MVKSNYINLILIIILIIFVHRCVESIPHKLTHKLHASINLRAAWRWPRTVAETCRSSN